MGCGLQKKEKLLGIDVRPLNGHLYGLGSTSRIYTINRTTGQATAVAGPFDPLLAGTSFSFDFNPVIDRIRIMSDAGQSPSTSPPGPPPRSAASADPGRSPR